MAVPVLIITPVRSFGELIQQALHEIGRYRAEILAQGTEALTRLKQEPVGLVILDYEIKDIQPGAFLQILQEGWPDVRVIGIPLDDQYSPRLDGESRLAARLSKPFYLPDLIDTAETLTKDMAKTSRQAEPVGAAPDETGVSQPSGGRPAPVWLQDVNLAAQYLTRLSLESSAQAALIASGDRIWAYAGQLPQPAAEELARAVSHHGVDDGGSDYARFVRLDTVPGEYLLYATGLGGAFILALAFETEMPFSKIRSQASELARKLALPPPAGTSFPQASPDITPPSASPPEEHPQPVQPDEWRPEEQHYGDWESDDDQPADFPVDWHPGGALAEGRHAFLENMLATMDVPDPGVADFALASAPDEIRLTDIPDPSSVLKETPSEVGMAFSSQKEEPDSDLQLTTTPDLRPISPGLHQLTYACVLIPRLPNHHLVGDLAGMLNDQLQRLCLAFGWRLEHLALRPNHLHWLVSAPPETSPGALIETIRQQTSRRIFEQFPRLADQNPSGDFWAAGYLLINGDKPLDADIIREFLYGTRTYQGLDPRED